MHSVRLTGPRFLRPEDVVGHLTAVQSQDFGPAKWSLGQRMIKAKDDDVQRAFDEGRILRTHILRPTWHFVARDDLRWMLELTGPRVHALNAYLYRKLDLDASLRQRSAKLVARALGSERHLTRKEIAQMLSARGIEASGPRLAYVLMHAELEGLVCSGPLHGKSHTYALFEARAPDARALTTDAALAELTERFFTSHGPATLNDFKAWSSLTLSQIREGLETVGSRLATDTLEGMTIWFSPTKTPPVRSPIAYLLQPYDEYWSGASESKWLIDPERGEGRTSVPRSSYNCVLVIDGLVAGRWKRTVQKAKMSIEVVSRRLTVAERAALAKAAQGHADFLGAELELSLQ